MTLPNFYIIGAQKSGTTTLANMLSCHPDVCMSSPKEPRFFEYEYPLGVDFYAKKYFGHYNGEKFIGEARVFNMMVPYVPKRIKHTTPDAKIIAILRNPIERAFSAWNHFRTMRPGREIRSLRDAMIDGMESYDPDLWASEQSFASSLDPMGGPYYGAYIEGSCYHNLLRNWYGEFNDIKLLFMQDLISNNRLLYHDVGKFIGLRNCPIDLIDLSAKNQNGNFSIVDIKEQDRLLYNSMKSFFTHDVLMLSDLTNRDLYKEWLI